MPFVLAPLVSRFLRTLSIRTEPQRHDTQGVKLSDSSFRLLRGDSCRSLFAQNMFGQCYDMQRRHMTRPTRPTRRSARHGFTIVHLLVIILILAFLVSLL